MTTTTTAPEPLDVSGTSPVPFARLIRVEARKMLDTRGGFWLMLITGILITLTMAITLLVVVANDVSIGSEGFSQVMAIPLSLLIPVFAILTVTSEWGQRTALTTFTLEPHRMRAVLAKWSTVTLLALSTIAGAIVLGAVGNILYGAMSGNEVVWDLGAPTLLAVIIGQLLYFWMAFGFGTVFLNTPGAITVYYIVALILPLMVYSTLYAIFGWAEDVVPWLDINYAMGPMFDPDEATELIDFVRTAFTALIWVAMPLTVGALRIRRAEVK